MRNDFLIREAELDLGESVPLGRSTTVFQAERCAKLLGVQKLAELGIRGRKIQILSDSRAAILSLSGFNSRSALVLQCRDVLESISQECEVGLYWVPGHKGIQGNEEADRLASAGSSSPFFGPEPAVGISLSAKRSIIREDMSNMVVESPKYSCLMSVENEQNIWWRVTVESLELRPIF
ncbi:hypothetical protein DMENIID0001_122590 [Sergentomyia squamirostris]